MRRSEPLALDVDVPTTAADIEALRAARARALAAGASAEAWRSWSSLKPEPRRRTHAGFEPFDLAPLR